MSLHFSHCREIRPSFEAGQLGVHSTWGRKHRVPLTYLLLREGSSWGACGKLAYLFSQIQEIILIPRQYGVRRTFLKLLYWNWLSSILEAGVSGNLWSFLKGVKWLFCMMWIAGFLRGQCKRNWPHLNLIWGTPSYFASLRWHEFSSRLVRVFLRTLWRSIRQIEAPYMFVWENGIALHAMQGNQGSYRGTGEVLLFFRVSAYTWGIFLSYSVHVHLKLEFIQRSQDTCLGTMDTSGI